LLVEEDNDQLIWLAVGPLAALVLGVALIPLRGVTIASNLTFVFLVLVIVVAEFGGRWAAVATALTAALSLDFFLTQPYMHLAIAEKNDVIAFAGLALCGLVAASLGSRRGQREADLRAARRQQALVHEALRALEAGGTIEHRAAQLLDASRKALPLGAVVLRDAGNNVVAAQPASRLAPEAVLADAELLPPSPRGSPWAPAPALPLPPDGARLPLVVDGRPVGWLDVWGSGKPASAAARRSLVDVARIAAALLVPRPSGPR
jgi:K+-sensing histidine kinase KdpD